MKNTVLKYGMYSLLTASAMFLAALVFGKDLSFGGQEIVGYLSIFVSLLFVFFGIKHFRDRENAGKIGFGKALIIGVLISLFAACGFAIVDYIYTTWINPDFTTEYIAAELARLKETLPIAEYEVKSQEFTEQMSNYGSSVWLAFMMFGIVTVIGFIFSLISALILQRK